MGESFKNVILKEICKNDEQQLESRVASPKAQVKETPFQGINKKIFEPFYISNTTKLLFEKSYNRSIVDIVRCFVSDSKQNNIKVYFSTNLIAESEELEENGESSPS